MKLDDNVWCKDHLSTSKVMSAKWVLPPGVKTVVEVVVGTCPKTVFEGYAEYFRVLLLKQICHLIV